MIFGRSPSVGISVSKIYQMNKLKSLHEQAVKAYQYLEQYENLRQVVVYLFIGGTAAIMDLAILYTLVSIFRMWYIAGATAAFVIIIMYSFLCHKRFMFRHKGKKDQLRFFLYFVSAIVGILITLGLLSLFVEVFHFWYFYSAIGIKFIVLVYNFLVNPQTKFSDQ